MKYNRLGQSDLFVSSIGFGAMSLDFNSVTEVDALLRLAVDNGVNFIDTADLYNAGMNEALIGRLVKTYRNDVILATKVGNRMRRDNSGWDWDVSANYLKDALEASLSRLETDYIDLYQIHGGTNQDNHEEVVSTLDSFVKEGKIRNYGISSIRPNVFSRYCEESNIVSNMMQYSILDRRPEEYFPIFKETNVSIIARGVLAQGVLINKVAKSYLDYTLDEIDFVQRQIKEICGDYGVSETAYALSYVLSKEVIASSVLGIRTKQQLIDVLHAYRIVEKRKFDYNSIKLNMISYKDHLL